MELFILELGFKINFFYINNLAPLLAVLLSKERLIESIIFYSFNHYINIG